MKITLEKDLPNAYTSFGFDSTFPGRMIERVEYELSDEDILRIGIVNFLCQRRLKND